MRPSSLSRSWTRAASAAGCWVMGDESWPAHRKRLKGLPTPITHHLSPITLFLRAGCACLMASLTGAWAQPAPSINSGGIVNAASSAPGAPVAPGSIASVYGNFLLSAPSWALGIPLPTNLGGLSLAFGAVEAPLLYASSGQVNLQIPWELAGQPPAVTATLAGQTSAPQTVNLAPFAPGIFSMNGLAQSSKPQIFMIGFFDRSEYETYRESGKTVT